MIKKAGFRYLWNTRRDASIWKYSLTRIAFRRKKFPGALLLPKDVMIEGLGRHRNKITEWELKKLKSIYVMSMQAIMARAHGLSIISKYPSPWIFMGP